MVKNFRKIFCVISVLLAAILMSVTVCFVSAEEVTQAPVETQAVETAPPVVETDPVYTQAPKPDVVATTAAPVYTQATQAYTTAAPVYTTAEPEYYADTQQYYTEYVEPYSFYQEPVTEYYNQNEGYDVETTEATEDATSLYDSDRDIDDTELNKSDWQKIADELAKANKSDDKSSSPFDYIKNSDKATGLAAFFNSLNWALTAGIISFVLAAVCVVIFIVFTKKKKKGDLSNPKDNKSQNKEAPKGGSKGKKSGVTDEEGYYVPRSQRNPGDYGDDYDSPQAKKVAKRRAKQDTAEINIPPKYRK